MKQLNIIASAGALLLVSLQAQAGDIISSVSSATTEFKVVNSSEATVSMSMRKDLAAGSYANGFTVGTWTASVGAGTVAFRVNSTVNSGVSNVSYGTSTNSNDATKVLNFNLQSGLAIAASIIDGWRVASQGVTAVTSGTVQLTGAQVLVVGKYPIGIDVAAYAF
ncbi:hypothetical protein [Serratia marcescens]|uniref:hypothetical protein n=1 Tax=Serratia marcescens TaxID=615 RepID=UPI003EE13607